MDVMEIAPLAALAVLVLIVMTLSGGRRGTVLALVVVALAAVVGLSGALAPSVLPGIPGLVRGTSSSTEGVAR